ncbi:MAG: glycosyltransferase family 4 protein [Deltaproteobacteria bacterium]|nr:glycosyltransferase family 4 protein [Deltaproteobacteria bacterium]
MVRPHTMHGIARYVHQLVEWFSRFDTPHQFFPLVQEDSPFLERSWPSHVHCTVLQSPWISFREQWNLPRLLKALNIDLFHAPSFVAPLFCPCKMIMTIHDLNHIVLPQYYTPLHQFYYSTVVNRSIKRSEFLLTVSEFSKNEIVSKLRVVPEKIQVTYNGVSELYKPIQNKDWLQYVRELYELPAKFLFCLANNKPHKNVQQLVRAYAYSKIEIPLVLAGPANADLIRLADYYGKKHQLFFVRFIEEEHLPAVYSLCHLFIYPSSYEGFGLPPLEALACGAPVVVANSSSLPEVVQDNAMFMNPFDMREIAATLQFALGQIETGNRFKEKGILHARKFSWKTMAENTLKVYERCVE